MEGPVPHCNGLWIAPVGVPVFLQKEVALGATNGLTLAQARGRAADARATLEAGDDPGEVHSAKGRRKQEAVKAGVPTFGDLADRYIEEVLAPEFKNEKARQPWELSLKTYAAPLRDLRVNTVVTSDVAKVLRPIWHAKHETARRTRWRIEALFGFAISEGYRNKNEKGEVIAQRNPASWKGNLDQAFKSKEHRVVKHHAALPYAKVPAFVVSLRAKDGLAAIASELLILTACRTGEVIGMRWDELDLDAGAWSIPATRMKAKRDHIVPLTKRCIAIIRSIPRLAGSPFVFPGHKPAEKQLSSMALLMALRRWGHEEITMHGFRSAFRDWAAECTSFPGDVAELCLAHVVGSETQRAYNRSGLFEKRRQLMALWADYCEPEKGHNVVKLGRIS